MSYLARIFISTILGGVLFTTIALAQCPPHAHATGMTQEGDVRTIHCGCDAGYQNRNGACRTIGGDPQCVLQAGKQLKVDQQQGCARVVGKCFDTNQTPLSASAIACVAACRQVGGCAIGCGIAGLAAEAVIEKCIDEHNSCFEAALARHRAAVKACKG